jgi:hypothetical protein
MCAKMPVDHRAKRSAQFCALLNFIEIRLPVVELLHAYGWTSGRANFRMQYTGMAMHLKLLGQ